MLRSWVSANRTLTLFRIKNIPNSRRSCLSLTNWFVYYQWKGLMVIRVAEKKGSILIDNIQNNLKSVNIRYECKIASNEACHWFITQGWIRGSQERKNEWMSEKESVQEWFYVGWRAYVCAPMAQPWVAMGCPRVTKDNRGWQMEGDFKRRTTYSFNRNE